MSNWKTPLINRRNLIQVGAAGVLGTTTMLAGCSSQSNGDDGEGSGSTPTDTPVGEIQMGGEVVVALAENPRSLNPHGPMDFTSSYVSRHLVDTLLDFDTTGKEFPRLAKEMPKTPDDKTYILTLREGVMFHEPYRREFTADDVVENFQRILDLDYGAEARPFFTGILVGDGIDPKETVQKTGKYEVTFNLAKPFAPFLQKLANARVGMLPMESIEEHGKDQIGTPQVGVWGTGPFTFVKARSDDHYTFERNPDYFLEGEGGQLPYLDRITFRVIPEESVRNVALETGEIDLTERVSGTDVEAIEQRDDLVVENVPSTETMPIVTNNRSFDPFTKTKTRHAIMHGINREAIIQTKFRGFAVSAWSTFPPWHWAYSDDATTKYPYDPEKAMSLLQEAGESGLSFTLNPANTSIITDTAQIIQQGLRNIGVEMEITPKDPGAVFESLLHGWDREPVGPAENLEAAMLSLTFGFDVDFNSYITHHTGSWANLWYYSNDQVDRIVEEARTTPDREERKKLYAEFQQHVTEDTPAIYTVWLNIIQAYNERMHNYEVYPTGRIDLNSVWVESA